MEISGRTVLPDLYENGKCYIQANESFGPRGYIIAMKNLFLMLEDLRTGKYSEILEKQEGESFTRIPDPEMLLRYSESSKDEHVVRQRSALLLVLMGCQDMARLIEDTHLALLEFAWELFIASYPQPEDWQLLYQYAKSFRDGIPEEVNFI